MDSDKKWCTISSLISLIGVVVTNEDMLREFTALPPEGKRVVTDLIAFLRNRYQGVKEAPASNATDIALDNVVGMWSDRAEMADSTEWVRKTRKDEWGG